MSKTYGFETLSIHAGAGPDPATGARALPIYQTTAYAFDDADHAAALFNLQTVGFIYSRLTNPTTAALETRLATLEGGRGGTVTASGHSAQVLALFPLMKPGDEIVASSRLYGGSLQQMKNSYPKFGWKANIVDADQPDNFKRALTARTKAFFIESLANPGGVISDIEAIARIADDAGVPLVVDNTMATPWLCKPIDYGATLVIHSTTKFLSGTGTSMGGAVVDSGKFDWAVKAKDGGGTFPSLAGPEPAYHGLNFFETFGDMAYTFHSHAVGLRDLGPSQAPFNSWITMLGIETLGLRMERHCANALALARWLESQPKVARVRYPGLASHPQHALAGRQMHGFGGMVSIDLDTDLAGARRFLERCEVFALAESLGGVESLIEHPAIMTHATIPPPTRAKLGIGDALVRLSVGIEDVDDLTGDLARALAAI